MRFHILTLFPEMISNGINTSITGRAIENKHISVEAVNIRDFSTNKHKKVDDYPYGGGAGMLMQPQPIYDAYQSVVEKIPEGGETRVVYVTPQGKTFNQGMAEQLAQNDDLIILCGHYEGVDERVLEEIVTDYVSIGDYVMTGGELAAMVMVDTISRLVPGVLHNDDSAETESFQGYLLEYPQYTRPEEWHEKLVPDVLLTGNSRLIKEWRLEEAKKRTMERRPDLYDQYFALQDCKEKMMLSKVLYIDMIELINRGRAILVAKNRNDFLLQDKVTGYFYHYGEDPMFFMTLDDAVRLSIKTLILHNTDLKEPVQRLLNLENEVVCYQVAYTPREKLPITGLYRADGRPNANGLLIKPLEEEHLEALQEAYKLHAVYGVENVGDYLADQIRAGKIFGAFLNGKPVGFAGIHKDGSFGMLEVLEEHRGSGIGKALETYIVNKCLEYDWIPYGQVREENEISEHLQKSLGLYFSKTPVVWLSK